MRAVVGGLSAVVGAVDELAPGRSQADVAAMACRDEGSEHAAETKEVPTLEGRWSPANVISSDDRLTTRVRPLSTTRAEAYLATFACDSGVYGKRNP